MNLRSKFIYIPLIIVTAIIFFFKPFTMLVLDAYLSHGLGQKVEIQKINFLPFHFDGVITTNTYPQGIEVHGEYKNKHLYMTTTSLGGLVTVVYKNHIYRATVEDVELKEFIELLGNKRYVKSGKINGTIFYHKRPREGYTKLKIKDAVLQGLDLNKKLSTINDAVQLNFASAFSRTFFDDNSSEITNIDHAQFNIALSHDFVRSVDVALRTENYRLSIGGNVHKKGHIDYFDVNLLDKQGCAVITQTLEGDIRKPKVKDTTTEVVNVAQSVPSSMFGISSRFLKNNNFLGAKKIMSEADHYIQETSKIVMPINCSTIYNGEIKHPTQKQNFL